MINPLLPTHSHIQYLCDTLELGICKKTPGRVYGGLHHRMWRLETDHGIYAIKQLSEDSDLESPDTAKHYNIAELIAEKFIGCGIPAIAALKLQDQYLQRIDNAGYLVYPWTDATALAIDHISGRHAMEIASIMATMHRANIIVPELVDPDFDTHSEENIVELVSCTKAFHGELSKELTERLPHFLNIAASHRSAMDILGRHSVVSHGDLDHKNVLWRASGGAVLIDWESACRMNPTFEILLEALDWSAVTSHFDFSLLKKMISAYVRAGGEIEIGALEPAFHCVLGNWLNWLMYNVGRSIDQRDPELRASGAEQVRHSLVTLVRLESLAEDLLTTVTGQVNNPCLI